MDQSFLLYGGVGALAFIIVSVSANVLFVFFMMRTHSSLFFELWAVFRDARLGEDDKPG